jgi:kumamolisin
MAFEKRFTLRESHRAAVAGARQTGAVPNEEIIHASVVLNRRSGSDRAGRQRRMSREAYGAAHGADPASLDTIEKFAHQFGLSVAERHADRRVMVLSGTAGAMQKAFGTQLARYQTPEGVTYRGRTGSLTLPTELEPLVLAVLGLDSRPAAKPHFRRRAAAGTGGSFTPPQIAQLYKFPTGVDGTGQTIGIIELGGGYSAGDLNTYFNQLGINTPQVSAVSVDGGQNQPGGDADAEVMLDIEVAGAVASGSQIAVYFTPNTDQGFHDAIAAAAHDTTRQPSVISISWGQSEDNWTQQALNAMNAALEDAAAMGVTVTVAAGDNGATDGVTDGQLHVDFPASSPSVVACGGTTLKASGNTISSEQVWNELASGNGATGGGVSDIIPLPAYQQNAGVPANPGNGFAGRGVPDVSGDADPTTGYAVLVDGQNTVVGGTSAVAPLWAGLVALINQKMGKPVGDLNPLIYQVPESAFRDIVTGGTDGYNAGPGWDPCTGLGSPNGAALLNALTGTSAAQAGS